MILYLCFSRRASGFVQQVKALGRSEAAPVFEALNAENITTKEGE